MPSRALADQAMAGAWIAKLRLGPAVEPELRGAPLRLRELLDHIPQARTSFGHASRVAHQHMEQRVHPQDREFRARLAQCPCPGVRLREARARLIGEAEVEQLDREQAEHEHAWVRREHGR